jgi:hypothetical protein
MSGRWRLRVWIAAIAVAASGDWVRAQAPAPVAPGGAPAAGLERAAQVEFLRTAKVIRSQTLSTGVTSPFRLTLTDGTVTHDAAFQTVNERATQANFGARGVEFNFTDSHHFNLAAFQIAGMLGLEGTMPVNVHRIWNGKDGTITWWLDEVFDERTRLKERRQAPNPVTWAQQLNKMRVFAALVGDTDRNAGNILIGTADWKLWMIDFTRAFRLAETPKALATLTQIDRTLLTRLRALDATTVRATTTHCLSTYEAAAVMKRRDALVAHFDQLVATKGAGVVLYGAEPKAP